MKVILLCFIFMLYQTKIIVSPNCEDSSCTNDSNKSSSILKYVKEKQKEWSSILKTIETAVDNYTPCSRKNCSCYLELISKDLKPFENGICKNDIENGANKGTLYQIIDNRLYREHDCMFPNRCNGIEHFIIKIMHKLPDMEFLINTKDWPMVPKYSKTHLPIFSFSKTNDYLDITYPAWSFWEGGPAIKLYPRGIGRWDLHRKSLMKEAINWPWKKKQNKGFFRGSRTSNERDNLIYLSRDEPSLVDAKYTKNQAWKSDADTLHVAPAEEVSFELHCKYKYLFNYRGIAASFRLKHIFLCGSLVFHVGNEWTEFFYFKLIPWVHYIPVSATASQNDIRNLLYFVRENDKMAKNIADRGFQFVKSSLRMEDVSCYWEKLLLSYSRLLNYKPKLRKDMYEIKH